MKKLILILLISFSGSFATYGPLCHITAIHYQYGFTRYAIVKCDGVLGSLNGEANASQALIDLTDVSGKEILSLVLTAYSNGKRIQIDVTNPTASLFGNWPLLRAFQIAD